MSCFRASTPIWRAYLAVLRRELRGRPLRKIVYLIATDCFSEDICHPTLLEVRVPGAQMGTLVPAAEWDRMLLLIQGNVAKV